MKPLDIVIIGPYKYTNSSEDNISPPILLLDFIYKPFKDLFTHSQLKQMHAPPHTYEHSVYIKTADRY